MTMRRLWELCVTGKLYMAILWANLPITIMFTDIKRPWWMICLGVLYAALAILNLYSWAYQRRQRRAP